MYIFFQLLSVVPSDLPTCSRFSSPHLHLQRYTYHLALLPLSCSFPLWWLKESKRFWVFFKCGISQMNHHQGEILLKHLCSSKNYTSNKKFKSGDSNGCWWTSRPAVNTQHTIQKGGSFPDFCMCLWLCSYLDNKQTTTQTSFDVVYDTDKGYLWWSVANVPKKKI